MKNYLVKVPIVGAMTMIVEASSEKDAIQRGLTCQFMVEIEEDGTDFQPEVTEMDIVKDVTEGNMCYAPLFHAKAELENEA